MKNLKIDKIIKEEINDFVKDYRKLARERISH